MTNILTKYLSVLALAGALFSCNEEVESTDDPGNWVRLSDYEGVARGNAVSFVVGDYAYIGLGSDGDDYLKDFWRYDAALNTWNEMAEFPGEGRVASVAFSIGQKGYVGTGYNRDLDEEELGDFWEYDVASDQWTQKADFGGTARYGAVAFSIEGSGYIGTGFDGNSLKDFWKYDPGADTWEKTVSIYGSKREGAVAFVVDGIAYVGTGQNNGSYIYDFYAFDPVTEVWTDLRVYDDSDEFYDEYLVAMSRYGASTFVMDGIAYITTGISDAYTSQVFAYDPVANSWDNDLTGLEGSSRSEAVAFTINNQGYVATGSNGSQTFDDIYAFYPSDEYDEYD